MDPVLQTPVHGNKTNFTLVEWRDMYDTVRTVQRWRDKGESKLGISAVLVRYRP